MAEEGAPFVAGSITLEPLDEQTLLMKVSAASGESLNLEVTRNEESSGIASFHVLVDGKVSFDLQFARTTKGSMPLFLSIADEDAHSREVFPALAMNEDGTLAVDALTSASRALTKLHARKEWDKFAQILGAGTGTQASLGDIGGLCQTSELSPRTTASFAELGHVSEAVNEGSPAEGGFFDCLSCSVAVAGFITGVPILAAACATTFGIACVGAIVLYQAGTMAGAYSCAQCLNYLLSE